MFASMREDIRAVFSRDPAARSVIEVLLCYSGLHAFWAHKVAHFFWTRRFYMVARLISQITRFFTMIEIHPGARIGRRFFIDHGAGVVIGETAEIGDDVLLYQGVVLGGTSLDKKKRHPTVGNNVVIGTGAVALGPINIGDGARIGSGSVVIKDVPPGATCVGIPGRIVTDRRKPLAELEHARLPDPVAEAIRAVIREQHKLEERLKRLEAEAGVAEPEDALSQIVRDIEKEFSLGAGI
ncbi:MAG: serine O-acetyltransferase [Chloroflexi bacterium]|nr:serine O-acetyltransferase [Chloroflexota bacterium]